MKKLFVFILVIIGVGWLICCPFFREKEDDVASENTLTDIEEVYLSIRLLSNCMQNWILMRCMTRRCFLVIGLSLMKRML